MEKIEEALAYLRTLANFGGTIQQARELAQKGVDKVTTISVVDENVALCSICNGHGRYQDGNSGREDDGYAANIVECECADSERRPGCRASAPVEPRTWHDDYKHDARMFQRKAASAPVAGPIQWPTMPPSKGQSPVLFEDGYAEGWAKCMDECQRAVSAASAPVAGEAQPVAWLRETTPGGGVWHRSVSLDEPPTGFTAIDRKTPLYAAPPGQRGDLMVHIGAQKKDKDDRDCPDTSEVCGGQVCGKVEKTGLFIVGGSTPHRTHYPCIPLTLDPVSIQRADECNIDVNGNPVLIFNVDDTISLPALPLELSAFDRVAFVLGKTEQPELKDVVLAWGKEAVLADRRQREQMSRNEENEQ